MAAATDAQARAVLIGGAWDDPGAFAVAADPRLEGGRPEWRKPDPVTLWTCAGCAVSAGKDVDDAEELVWFGGEAVHVFAPGGRTRVEYGQAYQSEDATEEAEHVVGGETFCPGCAVACAECRESVFTGVTREAEDTYDPGWSTSHPGNPFWGSVCIGCYEDEMRCPECHGPQSPGGGGCECDE